MAFGAAPLNGSSSPPTIPSATKNPRGPFYAKTCPGNRLSGVRKASIATPTTASTKSSDASGLACWIPVTEVTQPSPSAASEFGREYWS